MRVGLVVKGPGEPQRALAPTSCISSVMRGEAECLPQASAVS